MLPQRKTSCVPVSSIISFAISFFVCTTGCVTRAPQGLVQSDAADPLVQRWLHSLGNEGASQPPQRYFSLLGDIAEARTDGTLTDEQLLSQVFTLLMDTEDEQTLARVHYALWHSQHALSLSSAAWFTTIVPHLDGSDRKASRLASQMLEGSEILRPDQRGRDTTWTWAFSEIESYLRRLGGNDPSWRLMLRVYETDEDAALRTTSRVYLTRDDERAVDRKHKEIKILILSYDVATDEQRAELTPKIVAKLRELAEHAHWCVRMYALAVLNRNMAPNREDIGWTRDTTVEERMLGDKVAFLARWAEEIIRKAQRF